jgi:methylglutaconyl-CoA hydratase
MASFPEGYVYTDIKNNIAIIEFGHPASNSFTVALLERFANTIHQLSENPEVHLIIIKSEGEHVFCAGASFNELMAIRNLKDGEAFFSGFANVINAMRTCTKFSIVKVQGKAVGGGVGLIAASDYALATSAAAIKLSELSIGIAPFVIAPAVERKIGKAAFTELTLDAEEWKNAYWAREKGLYAKVFETHKELDSEVERIAQKLASYHPEALTKMKKIVWEGTKHWDNLLMERARISGTLALSQFTKDALQKFKNKNK